MRHSVMVLALLLLSATPAWAPPIQSIVAVPDSVTVTATRLNGITQVFTVTRADFTPAQLTTCAADLRTCESTINSRFDTWAKGTMVVRCHLFAVNPQILWAFWVGNVGQVPPANWWGKGP